MRISRRTSGGRGEYEISERSGRGLRPADLVGKQIFVALGAGIVIDTKTTLLIQGGKPRIRIAKEAKKGGMHLHRQLAAALLMPRSVREDDAMGVGLPVLQEQHYAIEHIIVPEVVVAQDKATLKVKDLVLCNKSHKAEMLGLKRRLSQIQAVWANRASLPAEISALLKKHEEAVRSGFQIQKDIEDLGVKLRTLVFDNSTDLNILYSKNEDVLEGLSDAVNSIRHEQPIELDEIEPEELELRKRVVREWRGWAANRGAASSRFRQDVRLAYKDTCVVCGVCLPKTPASRTPGIDAAHILPWAKYDLDKVSNGLCLCKSHHWAFDEGLLDIVFREGAYFVIVPEEVKSGLKEAQQFTKAFLNQVEGKIPRSRLPSNTADLPNPSYLKKLREEATQQSVPEESDGAEPVSEQPEGSAG